MTLAQTPVLNIEDNFIITNDNTGPVDIFNDKGELVQHWNGVLDYIWARRHYTIPPGKSVQVPWDVVRVYFGDPRSVPDEFQQTVDYDGNKGDIPPRNKELSRLAGLYGLYDQGIHLLADNPKIANVTITTVGTPDSPPIEIFTPAVDPDGEVGIYGHRQSDEPNYDIASQLAELRTRNSQMEAQIAALAAVQTGRVDDETIGRDEPSLR